MQAFRVGELLTGLGTRKINEFLGLIWGCSPHPVLLRSGGRDETCWAFEQLVTSGGIHDKYIELVSGIPDRRK